MNDQVYRPFRYGDIPMPIHMPRPTPEMIWRVQEMLDKMACEAGSWFEPDLGGEG